MNVRKEEINVGGSIFWIVLILVALMGLSYLLIWSFFNDSVKGVVVSVIFITMIISGILLSRLKVFDLASWGDNALSFTLGFVIWGILGGIFGAQSILSVSQNYLLATIASDLPQTMEIVVNVFIVPIAEELFWMIGIPFALISIMNVIGKKNDFFKNPFFQMFVIIAVCSTTFAIFHIGKAFIAFIIAAMIFRTIMIVMVYGDYEFNILKGVNLVAGFSVGAHIANNLFDTGVQKVWLVLSNDIPVLILVLVMLGFIFISAISKLTNFAFGKVKSLEG